VIVGIDVYHGKVKFEENEKIFRQKRSIGAFVAAIIKPDGSYHNYCGINHHKAREEILGHRAKEKGEIQSDQKPDQLASSEQLEGPIITQKDALAQFIQKACTEHKVTPDFIILYRDGLAKSQLQFEKSSEVKQIKLGLSTS